MVNMIKKEEKIGDLYLWTTIDDIRVFEPDPNIITFYIFEHINKLWQMYNQSDDPDYKIELVKIIYGTLISHIIFKMNTSKDCNTRKFRLYDRSIKFANNNRKKRNDGAKEDVENIIIDLIYIKKEILDPSDFTNNQQINTGKIEETCKQILKQKLDNKDLWLDDDLYIDFKVKFINKFIQLDYDLKNQTRSDMTFGEIQKWGEDELKEYKSDFIRLLHYDMDRYYSVCMHYALREIYKRNKIYLSKEERRLYLLFYSVALIKFDQSPYYSFDHKIPCFYRLFQDFICGINIDHTKKCIDVLFRKKSKYAEKIKQQWTNYINNYPVWMYLLRDLDNQIKREKRKAETKEENNIKETCLDVENTEDMDRHDIISANQPLYIDKVKSCILNKLTEKDLLINLNAKEKQVIVLLSKGYNLSEIANQLNLSVGRISQIKKQAYNKLKEQLNSNKK